MDSAGIGKGSIRQSNEALILGATIARIAAGRMAPVGASHLFFTIWAATQTYADFDVQVRAVLGKSTLDAADHARDTEHVVTLILRGCGL